MDYENEMTGQTSEESANEVDVAEEQAGIAEPGKEQTDPETERETNDAEFTDGANGGSESATQTTEQQPQKKPVQSKERNAEEARKRRERETAEAVSRAKIDTVIELTGGVNPYTGKEIKDAEDAEEYLAQKQIERNGGDPTADYSEYIKDRERKKRAEQQAEEERKAKMREDLEDFHAKYPDVNLGELLKNDDDFKDYADGKLGRMYLSDIYAGYTRITAKISKSESEKAAQALANSRANPGSAKGTAAAQEDTYFTREQVRKMSQAEVNQNLDNILKSQKKW